jgi:uncharacterized protein (DUF1697 family)
MQLIFDKWGFNVPVVIRKQDELLRIKKDNPFIKNKDIDLTKFAVVFLSNKPNKELIEEISTLYDPHDKFEINNKEIYLHCPNGFGRSKLTINFFERKLNVKCTARNWKTLNKLIEIAEEVNREQG